MNLNDRVTKLEEQASELEAKTKAREELASDAVLRKMIWPDAVDRPSILVEREPREYNLEEIALLRHILNARGSVLPESLETLYKDGLAREYTMTTDATGYGEELVPTPLYGQLWNDIALASKVAGLLGVVPMSSKTMKMSSLGDVTFYKPAGEAQAVTAIDLATPDKTIEAFVLKAQVDVSDELDEDSVVALIPAVRSKLVENAGQVIDDVILNGDTTTGTGNINNYGATIDADSRFLIGFDGIIHMALSEASGMASSLTTLEASDFVTLMALMGKYGIDPTQLAFVTDKWSYFKAIQLADVKTFDKMGARAPILAGQLASIWGVPIVVSDQIAKSDANGRVDGATPENNTVGRIIAIHRPSWRIGMRRGVTVRTERSEAKGCTSVVCTFRIGLECFGTRSSATHTALGYNITV